MSQAAQHIYSKCSKVYDDLERRLRFVNDVSSVVGSTVEHINAPEPSLVQFDNDTLKVQWSDSLRCRIELVGNIDSGFILGVWGQPVIRFDKITARNASKLVSKIGLALKMALQQWHLLCSTTLGDQISDTIKSFPAFADAYPTLLQLPKANRVASMDGIILAEYTCKQSTVRVQIGLCPISFVINDQQLWQIQDTEVAAHVRRAIAEAFQR